MSYQIPTNSPKATLVNGTQVAAALVNVSNPAASGISISIFQNTTGASNGWEIPGGEFGVVYWANVAPDGLYQDMVAKGGSVKYMQWLVARLNSLFLKFFPQTLPPSGEPKNEAEAEAFVIASLAAMHINIVNGSPVLQ